MKLAVEADGLNPLAPIYGMAVAAPLFWAGNFVVARLLHDEIPPFQISFWRWVIALVVLALWTRHSLGAAGLSGAARAGDRQLLRKDWLWLAFLGAIGVTAFNCLVYVGLGRTTVVNGALINALMPVLTFLFAAVFIGERFTLRRLAGLALCLTGALVIAARGDPGSLGRIWMSGGDLLILAAGSCWALYTVLVRWRPSALPVPVFLVVTTAFGVAFHLPLIAWEVARAGTFAASPGNLAALVYLGIFPSVLAYIFWNRAIASIGPGRTGMFMYLMPLFSAVLAVVILGERVHAFHLAGAALIFSGIMIVTRRA